MKIIVVSDVHLGSDKSNKAAFNAFLASLHDDDKLTDLVLMGDIVDMWRRDASGVFLENMDTVSILKDLKKRISVHWLAGNHDFHLLKLKNRAPHYGHPFEFHKTLELVEGDHTYRFSTDTSSSMGTKRSTFSRSWRYCATSCPMPKAYRRTSCGWT